ncbi:MAG: carbon-nitrogen hydrolase family protein [Alphaproteobacteria bacterium]|nr:carbon-nitrogen hydrolase family protein [Alphaproteobacteria bacterium]MCB9793854.1 carbon-nitrogen hydrolase family protein [Alphaproteobacteria bacterium]
MSARALVACIQLRGSSDLDRNLSVSEALIRRAAAAGARLIATPEATTFLGPHAQKVALAEPVDGPVHARFAALARELGVWLLLGSGAERAEDEAERCHNTSILFDPEGRMVASYRKLHLFDVDIPGGVRFRESATCAPGDEVVVADTELGRLGLSICYDLRFPELYRRMADQGARLLAVPSAFTLMTGKDHWHVLLRARAIETQCFVLAPAQWGPHDDEGLRRSYGHSLIIDPWGVVLAECGDGEGFCIAELDLDKVDEVRRAMPVRQHRRL